MSRDRSEASLQLLGFLRWRKWWLSAEKLYVQLPKKEVDDLICALKDQGLRVDDPVAFWEELSTLISAGRYVSGEAYVSGLVPWTHCRSSSCRCARSRDARRSPNTPRRTCAGSSNGQTTT